MLMHVQKHPRPTKMKFNTRTFEEYLKLNANASLCGQKAGI